MNSRSKEILVFPEAYSYFKELFKKNKVDNALLEYQD